MIRNIAWERNTRENNVRKSARTLPFALFTVFFLSVLLLSGCSSFPFLSSSSTDNVSWADTEGRVVLTLTDAAADLGTVQEIWFSIDSIELYSAAEGWVTLSSQPQSYNLLQLRDENRLALLSDSTIDSGDYSRLRLDLGSVTVIDADGRHQALLPDTEYVIDSLFSIESASTVSVVLDVLADVSLHTTEDDDYVFAPVISVEQRKGSQITIASRQNVLLEGGETVSRTTFGMDVSGDVGVDVRIDADAVIPSRIFVTGNVSGRVTNRIDDVTERVQNATDDVLDTVAGSLNATAEAVVDI